MTIKRQLFFSNVRMVFGMLGSLITAALISRITTFALSASNRFQEFENIMPIRRLGWIVFFLSFAAFVTLFSIINTILTNRMTKKITRPLEILTNSANKVRKNDFSCRIEYTNGDEFRPVCEAFNLMAEQLETSARMRQKDEANRRELLAGISHDLCTPLTAISGYLDGLESGVASTPQMREKYFNTIKNKTAGMKHIIEQLFLFSKLDMNEFAFSPRRVDIVRAISHMIEELAEEYEMQGLVITIAQDQENVFVYADMEHFRRVVINILENSIKYKEKETGRMEISISIDNNFAEIVFSDDGPGVKPDALPNLFNVFYRSDPSRNIKGSGLGLPISAKIIERSGGTIYAKNGKTRGFIVVIRLPLQPIASNDKGVI